MNYSISAMAANLSDMAPISSFVLKHRHFGRLRVKIGKLTASSFQAQMKTVAGNGISNVPFQKKVGRLSGMA